jgi:hypothetical protein
MPGWFRILLAVAGLTIAVAALLWFGWHGEAEKGASIAAAGLLLILASRFDQLTSIKAFGIEAELKEKVREADDAIRHLRELAVSLAEPTLRHGMRLGRMGTFLNFREAIELQSSVEVALRKLQVPDDKIKALRKDYEYFTLVDLCEIVREKLRKHINEENTLEDRQIREKYGSPIRDSDGHTRDFSALRLKREKRDACIKALLPESMDQLRDDPDRFERLLDDDEVLPKSIREHFLVEVREDIAELKHFIATGRITDIETVLRRNPRYVR